MTRRFFLAAALSLAAPLLGLSGSFSRIACNVASLPPERQFVAELLSSRVEARTPPSDRAQTLDVRFVLDAAIPGENADITVKGNVATIRAGRFVGLVQGAGVLLRRIRYGQDAFSLDDGTYAFAPKKGLRMAYFARHFHNWYHYATAEELATYIDDLVLAGHNAFNFQYAYPTADRAGDTEEEKRRFADVSEKALARVHALDCGFCASGGSNQAPLDSPEELRGVPNSDRKRGNLGFNVCPAKPGAMEYLCDYRKRQLKELDGRIDYFIYWPFDEGGCECDQCRPWGGKGFLELIERYETLNKAAHPAAKSIVSTWVFHDDDWAGLYKWLETYDGVKYILADSHTDFPKYPLEHPVPKNIPVITFPEISMWGRVPWGGYGATAMPKRFERLFRQAEPISDGFMCYSEGLYEDINKEVVNGLYIDPAAKVDDLLRTYASYYLPGTDPEDFVQLCNIFEANHRFPGNHSHPRFNDVPADSAELAAYRQRASDACRIAAQMNGHLFPAFRQSWRWRLIYLRALIDGEILAAREAAPESARLYFDELVKIYHAERQLADWRRTGKSGYTTPRYPAPTRESKNILKPGGWEPSVRARLEALIERNRGNPDAYAVFDFDYTSAIGDLSYVCMWHLLETFDLKTDDFRALFAKGLDPQHMEEIDAISALAAKLKPLSGRTLTDRPEWQEFVGRFWVLYRKLHDEIGEYRAYLWRTRLFTGYTPSELRQLAKVAIVQALKKGCLSKPPYARTEKRGLAFPPEIKDLFEALRKAGIAIYIVSGSFKETLLAATGPDFGFNLDPANVFGADLKRDAAGRYYADPVEGCVKSRHKPEFIRAHIAPRHHGKDPVLVAGDSIGDHSMLTEFKNMQLALLFQRNWRERQMWDLIVSDDKVAVQGRDETRGCFIPTHMCIQP